MLISGMRHSQHRQWHKFLLRSRPNNHANDIYLKHLNSLVEKLKNKYYHVIKGKFSKPRNFTPKTGSDFVDKKIIYYNRPYLLWFGGK